jgi:D-alanyl-D-alanine carboxypeptidase (penicillin-binding protein 5/6)
MKNVTTFRLGLFTAVCMLLVLCGCESLEPERRPSQMASAPTVRPAASVIAPTIASDVLPTPMSAPSIYADSAILIDAATGRTIYEKNANSRRQVASTQKLLTALLIAERGSLDGSITIAPIDTQVEPVKLGLRAGQTYSRRSLLTAMMVKSSNDAAAALGRDHSGSVSGFVQAMNYRAALLGADSSYFANAHGLPAGQFSTARDVARIAFYAYRKPDLRAMMLLPAYTFRFTTGRTTRLEATNKLLTRSPIFNGMKTGYTVAAGRCFVASASYGGRQVILVQLGSRTRYIFDDAERLIYWALNR